MLFSQDIAIDLGTSNTVVYVKGRGIVIRQPSVVAVSLAQKPAKVIEVGNKARDMIGRTPGSVVATHPLRDGVIADFDLAAQMLEKFIQKAMRNKPFAKARLIICIPSGVSEVERRNVHDVAIEAGARYVSLIEEPMAAAIGAKLPVTEAIGSMVVDIGGGTSEVAVISLGDIVTSASLRIGGKTFDSTIVQYIRKKYSVLIGDSTAEDIKIKIGSAIKISSKSKMEVRGRNLIDGLPKTIEITADEVREAIEDPLSQIIETIRQCLEKTPPELSADIMENGIMLTGGGALMMGIDKRIEKETHIPVNIAINPLECVCEGAGLLLSSDELSKIGKKF